jgi:hypothetical protein
MERESHMAWGTLTEIERLELRVSSLEKMNYALVRSLIHYTVNSRYESENRDINYEEKMIEPDSLIRLIENNQRRHSRAHIRLEEIHSKEIPKLRERNAVVEMELHEYLAIQSMGLDCDQQKLTRYVPVRIYISEDSDMAIEVVSTAIAQLVARFGFEISEAFPSVTGSWFKKWFVKTKDAVTQPEVLERLEKFERALEIKGLGTPQADIDQKAANSFAMVTKAVSNIDSVALQFGTFLYLKQTNKHGVATVVARTLSQRELMFLENNPDLLKSPATTMAKLAQMCESNRLTSAAE